MRTLAALAATDRRTTANLLLYIAEADTRRLYREAGYPSLFEFCVRKLRFSDDVACNRIRAARTARTYPFLYEAIADGRIHLSAIRMLAPHLTAANAEELVTAATHRRKWEIERLLAARFPLLEPMRLDEGISALRPSAPARVQTFEPPAPGRVESAPSPVLEPPALPAPGRVDPEPSPAFVSPAPGRVDPPTRVHPISAQRYMFQFPVPSSDHDRFRHLQGLLSHAVPSGDVTLIFGRMLVISIDYCEKRKYGVTERPLANARPAGGKRTIPAHVRREVWLRDEGQCTFVAANGHRCATRRFLEFDHVEPVARGGQATPDGIRLRCRAHNQLEAERVFGLAFMQAKRATT
jgi:hypothetical protein